MPAPVPKKMLVCQAEFKHQTPSWTETVVQARRWKKCRQERELVFPLDVRMLILDRWSWRFWSPTHLYTTGSNLWTIAKFRQEILPLPSRRTPLSSWSTCRVQERHPSLSVSSQLRQKTVSDATKFLFHILNGPWEAPFRNLLTWWMRTIQNLMSSSSPWPKQPTLFKNKALTNQRFAPLGTEKCLPRQESEGGISAENGLCLADCRVHTEGLKSWHQLGKLPGWGILISKVFLKRKYLFVCVYCEKPELGTKQLDIETHQDFDV